MKSRLQIGEFAKLTGVTVKTVLHYHKIGLLAEPLRSPGGYRLYGPGELNRLQAIKRLKTLGLSLEQIKAVVGEVTDPKSERSVLESLEKELLLQMNTLQHRLNRVRELLTAEPASLHETREDPASFRMVTEIVGTQLYDNHPQLMELDRQISGVFDDFAWGLDHQELLRQMAEYFQAYPQEYQRMLDCSERVDAIADLPEDAKEVQELARDCVDILTSIPLFKTWYRGEEPHNPLEPLISEMVNNLLTPAQAQFCRLCQLYMEEYWAEKGTGDWLE